MVYLGSWKQVMARRRIVSATASSLIHRIWRAFGLQPHRSKSF